MRRIALIATILAASAAIAATSATGDDTHTYFIEFDNAFGLVKGSEVKVAGVQQGTIKDLFINSSKRAVVKVELSGPLSTLGQDTICSSEPQSLIAEYFVDCQPKGPPLTPGTGSDDDRTEAPDIPVTQTTQTVQNDLVQSALRAPFKDRLQLLINEFGTALAGNPENLNDAIRRGAPALTQTRQITKILAGQNTIIRDLNANSDTIFAKLAARRKDVVAFIENANATAQASAERRTDLSTDFAKLDDFLAELKPTMADLSALAKEQTPLLADLRQAAPGLNTLSRNLPDFNAASTVSLRTLGSAAVVGRRALRNGADEIKLLDQASKRSFSVADNLAKLLQDLDDPSRAVEIDSRANRDTGRKGKTGYTGLEGLLNYVYYQTGAINQYDEISHLLHFSLFEIGSGPCADYNGGGADADVPAADGGRTKNLLEADRCVSWVGPNQPGINQNINTPPYNGSVCPDGSTDLSICNPANTRSTAGSGIARTAGAATGVRGIGGNGIDVPGGSNGVRPAIPDVGSLPQGSSGLPGGLDNLLDLPGVGNPVRGTPKLGRAGTDSGATRDLLGFLFND